MMKSWEQVHKEGGTAYPNHPPTFEIPDGSAPLYGTNGMTLRERIALEVMAALVPHGPNTGNALDDAAQTACIAADALLEQLGKLHEAT